MSTTTAPEARFPVVPLTAMSFAAFVYVTFEMFAVGLIKPMASDLGVSESSIGLLMTVYATVVAVVTIPAMLWVSRFNKRTVFLITLAFLATGIVVQALTVNYGMLAIGRTIAALTHGVVLGTCWANGSAYVPRSHWSCSRRCVDWINHGAGRWFSAGNMDR